MAALPCAQAGSIMSSVDVPSRSWKDDMGFKLAMAVTDTAGEPPEALLRSIYDEQRPMRPSGYTVSDCLWRTNETFFMEHAGRLHLFDWDFVGNALDNGYEGNRDFNFYSMHSVVNSYGFARYSRGKLLRRRCGSGDDGITADEGTPFDVERAEIAECCGPEHAEQGWAAWLDAEQSGTSEDDWAFDHSNLGESVVFAVMRKLEGFRFDQTSPIYDMPVLAYVRPRRSWLQRLLGRRS